VEHDLAGKQVSTFPDHALAGIGNERRWKGNDKTRLRVAHGASFRELLSHRSPQLRLPAKTSCAEAAILQDV
jgi:hypothetical protein